MSTDLARSGCRTVNALCGNRMTGHDPACQDQTALDRIATVASRVATMGTEPVTAICRYAPLIRHLQFADIPGRGRAGAGALDFAAIEQALLDVGYDGFVGLEYVPD